jgi:hypothetical protein
LNREEAIEFTCANKARNGGLSRDFETHMQTSPILFLLKSVAGSPSAVAPELTSKLVEIATSGILNIEFCTGAPDPVLVDANSGRISFDITFAEALWGISYAFVVFPDMFQEHGSLIIDRGNGRAAARLFDRSKDLLLGKVREWPCHLPAPWMVCFKNVRAANELFLASTGWILLHEVGHVYLDLGGGPINEEKVDAFATRWVLGWEPAVDIPSAHYWKRCAGIGLALVTLTATEFFDRKRGGGTHPDPVERCRMF